jgi:pimeloyl-ACP methyl ester carboxylesterase
MMDVEHAFGAAPIDRRIRGSGLDLHCLDWGRASGPTIMLLHGGGLNAHTWDVVCDLLHSDYRCVALDLRGHGDSDWSDEADYSLEAHASDISAVVGGLALDRVILVGMSLGGAVALKYAEAERSMVLGLVLVDTGPGGSRQLGRRRLGAFMEGPAEYASLEEVIDRAIAFNPRRSRERLRRTLLQNLRQTPAGTWQWKYDRRLWARFTDPSVGAEERARLMQARRRGLWDAARAVNCPALVVRGSESDMFLDEDAERTAAGFAHARWLRIDGASHTVQSDRPYEFAAALRDFIETDVRMQHT